MMLSKNLKILIATILFALAVLLGLAQRQQDPYVFDFDSDGTQQEFSEYYNKAGELVRKNSSETEASFLAVGDIMLSRNVAGTIQKAGDPLLPFSKMTDVFASVDFSFANLESPFSGKDTFNPSGTLVFNAPRPNIAGLVQYNFKALNLANNHALDQGKTGVDYTLSYLDENGIQHTGMGKNLDEAWKPAVVTANGITICFVGASYSSINDNGTATNNYVARIEDTVRLKSSISNLKSSCNFSVATMHAGTEYTTKPNQAQVDFARAAIDAGADMVIGAHPHWVQTIEKYQGKYIFYSLGNFIFDQEWSRETKEGLAIKIELVKDPNPGLQGPRVPASLKHIELIPVVIENYSTPRPATPEESKKLFDRIGQTGTVLLP